MKKIIVIGAGFSGLATATSLAQKGYEVTILEKNETAGGRARVFESEGFTFDMGPSWYWMPDIFEDYFGKFNKKVEDYYHLVRLDPSYEVIFENFEKVSLPAGVENLKQTFEKIEKGSAEQLQKFLDEAAYKYKVGIGQFVWKPSKSIWEFFSLQLLIDALKLDIFKSYAAHARKYFSDSKLLKIIEFPALFLGAIPENTPALYSLMNFAEMKNGTWYPLGGMHQIVKAMVALAREKGVKFKFNSEVVGFGIKNSKVNKVYLNNEEMEADIIVASADYRHIDLLLEENQNYSDQYWNSRILAPSSLIFYLGINKRIEKLVHHNLFFDEDFSVHADEIYTDPQWPQKPLFYVSAPSKTDSTIAPEGCENLFILMPVAPDLEDSEEIREKYFKILMARLEAYCGEEIIPNIIYKKSYAQSNFKADYHAFKGNAYGLANTLWQTAFLKPSLKNKKLKNFYYTGQLTVPGPGVPPSIISGLLVAEEVEKDLNK
ncbi:MAG: phytoene desaturase family protein [Bacteroidota bacterium]